MNPAQKRPADLDCDARALLITRLASGALELPVMPSSAATILEACRDDNAGAMRVAEAVNHDPLLAAHVLRVANSAAYAPSEPVVSLAHAVSLMGLTSVSQIALAVCIKGKMFRADRYVGLLSSVWPRSALAAGWARETARLRDGDVEGAFLLGLLHDIGRPVILQVLIDLERETKRAFGDEQALSAMDYLHARVGAELLRQWNMPTWMSNAIAWHHEPQLAPENRDEALMAALSERLAGWTYEEQNTSKEPDLTEDETAIALRLNTEQMERLASSHERVRASAALLN